MRFYLFVLSALFFPIQPEKEAKCAAVYRCGQPSGTEMLIADTTSVAYLMGKFIPSQHPEFHKIDKLYSTRENAFLRKEAYVAFKAMAAEAAKSGITLRILSATRNFQDQKKIWERKWIASKRKEQREKRKLSDLERAEQILKFSSMPGSSRHHWGSDIDLNSLDNGYFAQGEGKLIYQWLQSNAWRFGYCQPYTSRQNGRTGYEEEKWHWSYRPLADGLTLAAKNKLKDELFRDFSGAELAPQIQMLRRYVLGVSANCFAKR